MGSGSRRSCRRKTKNRKQKQKRGSKTKMEDLPHDVSLTILKKLPITSLLSLKLVCKSWCNLASHPDLTPHHNPYCLIIRPTKPSTKQVYLTVNGEVVRRMDQPMIQEKFYVGSILSSNGLLCLLLHKYSYLQHYRVCLYNPLTDESCFLPDLELPTVRGTIDDKIQYINCLGFGFCLRTSEYKIVRSVKTSFGSTFVSCDRMVLQTEVFTLGKNGCERSEIDNPFVFPGRSSDVVVGGAIHWLCEDEYQHWDDLQHNIIIAFDLFEERFRKIPKPDSEIDRDSYLSVLGGCLCITVDFPTGHETQVHIWLLMEYAVEESWTKKFVITTSTPLGLAWDCHLIRPLFLLNGDKLVISYKSVSLYSYDPKEELSERIAEFGDTFEAIYHAPSLVSPFF